MTFKDVIRNNLLQGFTGDSLTSTEIVLTMSVAFVLAVYLFFAYRLLTKNAFYSKSYNISMAAISLVTCGIIIAMQSSLVISLGMVGALSIVRFRAAIKEPMEIVFLFWSLAVGIVIGAGMIPLAIIGSVIIGVILVLFANRKIHHTPYILIVNCEDEKAEESALNLIEKSVDRMIVKSKTVNASGVELTAEIRVKNDATSFVNRVNEIGGVSDATLVTFNGEYMS